MKTTFPLLTILFSVIVFLFSSCKKDPTKNAKLPPITQEGKNTIGFTVDGEVWVPYYECGFMGDPCGEIHASYGEAGGAAPNGIGFGFNRIRDGKFSGISISTTGSGTITSSGIKTDSISVELQGETLDGHIPVFRGPLSGSKFVITKFDPQNQIISGEFELVLKEYNGIGRILNIRDGRFDLRFNACKCSN